MMELRKLLLKAGKQLCIQDRYINSDIFNFLDELRDGVVIRLLTQKEHHKGKPTLMTIYRAYSKQKNNLQIRVCELKEFHSRKLLIDEKEGYLLDFTFQDVGKNESSLYKISKIKEAVEEFENLWTKSCSIEEGS